MGRQQRVHSNQEVGFTWRNSESIEDGSPLGLASAELSEEKVDMCWVVPENSRRSTPVSPETQFNSIFIQQSRPS